MKIGMVVPGFSRSEDDWCVPALLNLVKALSAKVEVIVFALRYPHKPGTYFVHGTKVHALGGALASGANRFQMLRQARKKIQQEHASAPFQLLHAFWAHEPGLVAALTAKNLGLPIIVSLMGGELARLKSIGYGDQLSLVSRRMIHYSLKRADRITVGSQYLKSIARDYLSQKQMNQVHYLPLGVNGSMFCTQANSQSSSQTRDKIDILHVGSLVPVKNQRALLQALPLVLKKRAAHLHLIGKGPLAKDLKHLASSLNIWNHITFHGEIPHHHLSEYYARADLFMLTSLFESQGMVVLEAAACGVPIVGTAVGVLPELQPAVKCLPTNALNDLPEVILELLAAPDNLQEMAKAVRLQVTKNFLIEQTVTRLLQIYNHLL